MIGGSLPSSLRRPDDSIGQRCGVPPWHAAALSGAGIGHPWRGGLDSVGAISARRPRPFSNPFVEVMNHAATRISGRLGGDGGRTGGSEMGPRRRARAASAVLRASHLPLRHSRETAGVRRLPRQGRHPRVQPHRHRTGRRLQARRRREQGAEARRRPGRAACPAPAQLDRLGSHSRIAPRRRRGVPDRRQGHPARPQIRPGVRSLRQHAATGDGARPAPHPAVAEGRRPRL